ncbi:Sensor protein ZraS [Rubripirellula tenax]|uniref:histidine kinase n=1 Tax=Rubripirellula tenax TaxID=2528015 RepID=A0A5C6FGR2_9BACT|nr:HAMP domain-containing sensor histidine kinase [Rubripirellula tenax]TWU60628.1 Sensor protein ZraS [Rubripirellula tenax]
MKLAAKLILIFMLGVLAIVSLFTWQTIRHQHARVQQQTQSHASDLVTALKPAIESAYRDGGTVTIQKAIEFSTQRLERTPMRWVDGREVPSVGNRLTSREISSVTITNKDGARVAYSYVPLKIDGADAGAVEVAQTMTEQDAQVRDSLLASIVSLLGVTLFSGAVIYCGGVQLVAKPLGKLIDQVNTIGDGKLAQPPAISSNDELGRLAGAISQMSHRLSEQQDAIRHTDRLGTVGTLAAGMAHELGTPLNVVSGRAGLIASGKLSSEEITSSAQTIKMEADRMTTIIRHLLDFARQAPSTRDTVDLNEITIQTCDLMEPLAKKSAVELKRILDDEPVYISGDPAQLQQVLTNLIVNAVQAMPDGGEVKITLEKRADQVRLGVADTGHGIPSEDLGRVFEPFFTTKDVGEGTGLGLSIAYGIVREHDGDIKVESDPGNQTRFVVTFPLIEQNDNGAMKAPQ